MKSEQLKFVSRYTIMNRMIFKLFSAVLIIQCFDYNFEREPSNGDIKTY